MSGPPHPRSHECPQSESHSRLVRFRSSSGIDPVRALPPKCSPLSLVMLPSHVGNRPGQLVVPEIQPLEAGERGQRVRDRSRQHPRRISSSCFRVPVLMAKQPQIAKAGQIPHLGRDRPRQAVADRLLQHVVPVAERQRGDAAVLVRLDSVPAPEGRGGQPARPVRPIRTVGCAVQRLQGRPVRLHTPLRADFLRRRAQTAGN